MSERLFGTNGVRGVINQDLTAQFSLDLGKAIGTFMQGNIAIGNDPRTSADMVKSAVAAGIMSTGANVIDIGMVPTPVVQFYVKAGFISGGVMITASHNPPEFNGIKCIDADGTEMPREKEEKIEQIYFQKAFANQPWDQVGALYPRSGAIDAYLASVVSLVDVESIKNAKLKVVLDCANGASTASSPRLLQELGVKAITLNGNPMGTFPGHPSEPTEDHLKDLLAMVRETGADLGIAHDGDADRTIFVDNRGRYLYGDKSLAVVASQMVKEHNGGTVVTPVSSSNCVEEVVKAAGGEVVYTKVGAPIVSRKMIEIGAIFGGEENGGLIFPQHQYCRDGAMTAAKMLEIIAKQGPLADLVDQLPQYSQDKRKIVCPNELKNKVLGYLVNQYSNEKINTIDGVKICYADGWTLVRPSGTEPLFRIYSEARTEIEAKERSDECEKVLSEAMRKYL